MSGLLLASAFEGHEVRVVGTPEAPEWVAADVCRALGLKNHRDAIRKRIPSSERGVARIYTPGGEQEVLTVTEPGLYRLIFRSHKPEAQAFSRWVFAEVLPSIRRTGRYDVAGMVLVKKEAWEENQLAVGVLSDAYAHQAAAATQLASLAASMLAHRRYSKPASDPRQRLIRWPGGEA